MGRTSKILAFALVIVSEILPVRTCKTICTLTDDYRLEDYGYVVDIIFSPDKRFIATHHSISGYGGIWSENGISGFGIWEIATGRLIRMQPANISRRILELIIADNYRQGRQMLNFSSRWETYEFLKREKAYLPYTEDDLEQDVQAIRNVLSGTMEITDKKVMGMTSLSNEQAIIIRTERGLTIAGTRITIYDVMDYLASGWSPKLIQDWLPLTKEQVDAALSYIEAHPSEVEAEYQTVLHETEEIRKYWEDKNRERLAQIAKMPPKPGQEEIHAKLQAWKAKLGLTP